MDSEIQLNISFRFSELSENQVDALKAVIPEAGFGTHYKTKRTTGSVPLSEPNIPLLSTFIEKHGIENDMTDIFISFVSEYDTRIIDVPNCVNHAVVQLGSKLTLSYTIV